LLQFASVAIPETLQYTFSRFAHARTRSRHGESTPSLIRELRKKNQILARQPHFVCLQEL